MKFCADELPKAKECIKSDIMVRQMRSKIAPLKKKTFVSYAQHILRENIILCLHIFLQQEEKSEKAKNKLHRNTRDLFPFEQIWNAK